MHCSGWCPIMIPVQLVDLFLRKSCVLGNRLFQRKEGLPVVPHEAVPEVSKRKVYVNQKKHVPIGIACVCVCVACLSTSHFAQPFF